MKAICPISGIPFRTYDSLPVKVSYQHPIFSLSFDQLVHLVDIIKTQDEEAYKNVLANDDQFKFIDELGLAKKITDIAIEAIQERNYSNPIFKVYQTKHLTLLAFMQLAQLLEVEEGFNCRPSPAIIGAYFWQGIELFIWASGIRNNYLKEFLPKYRVSKHNTDMGNLSEYLSILAGVKDDLGQKYRSYHDENKLRSMEHALSILAKRRDVYKQEITSGNNKLAAHWAMMITRPPKDIKDFWYAILSSPSLQITFEGVLVKGKMEPVYKSDLNELKDFLEDNLIGPRGDEKSAKNSHEDDNEHYFVARQTVLSIVRKHIAILEQGTAGYQIINIALGSEILSSTDDQLHEKAIEAGLKGKPSFIDYTGQSKITFIKAMASWRLKTRQELLDLSNMIASPSKDKEEKKEGGNYEIL